MLKECQVSLGPQFIEGLACDVSGNSFKDHYYRLFNILNMDHGKHACSLTFEDFLHNYTLLIYDFRLVIDFLPLNGIIERPVRPFEADHPTSYSSPEPY